jgi:hypothetical protein
MRQSFVRSLAAVHGTWRRYLRCCHACGNQLNRSNCSNPRSGNASGSPFIRSIFPGRTGWSGSGGTGAEAQWLFMPEPDTRKIVRN